MLKIELCKMYQEYRNRGSNVEEIRQLYDLTMSDTLSLLEVGMQLWTDRRRANAKSVRSAYQTEIIRQANRLV